MREAVEPGVVGDVTNHALAAALDNLALGQAEKADVQVVQTLALRSGGGLGGAVGVGQVALLGYGQPGKAVVGWVAQHHQDLAVLLDGVGSVALGFQVGQEQVLLGLVGRAPAGQGVGQVNAGPLGRSQRCAQRLQQQPQLQVGDDKGRGHDFKTKDPLLGSFFNGVAAEGVSALGLPGGGDAPQHFHQVRTGAAAGIQHVDPLVGQAVGQAQFLAQYGVDAGDHVLHNLWWGVPDAQLLAQLRREGLQKRLVKILDGLPSLKTAKKFGSIHPIEGIAGPVEHLDQVQPLAADAARLGQLPKQGLDHGHAQIPGGDPPIEAIRAAWVFVVPQHPGRKDAVKEGLDQGRAEKALAFGAFKG